MKIRAFLLLLCWVTGAHAAEKKPAPGGKSLPGRNVPVVQWWNRVPLCDRIGLTTEQRVAFATELRNQLVSYQILQTSLRDARARQSAMLLDPAVTEEALHSYNRSEVVRLSDELQTLNFKARLLVRRRLTKAQLETVGRELPGFFTGRWFESSKTNVRQGTVVIEE